MIEPAYPTPPKFRPAHRADPTPRRQARPAPPQHRVTLNEVGWVGRLIRVRSSLRSGPEFPGLRVVDDLWDWLTCPCGWALALRPHERSLRRAAAAHLAEARP